MARTSRNFGNSGLNHCIIRGINKMDIFYDDQDRCKFIKILKQYKPKSKIQILEYVLMQNHVHLIVNGEAENISDFFHSCLIAYSAYFNLKYERVGHLFENRYKNKPIETESYLKNLVKYIHFNPEKAGICSAKQYKWSSYKEFFKESTWVDTEFILKHYDENLEIARSLFEQQHSSNLDEDYKDYAEYEITNRLTDDELKYIINDIETEYKKHNKSIIEKDYIDDMLKELINIKGASINQISRVTGVSRKVLTRLKEEENRKKFE